MAVTQPSVSGTTADINSVPVSFNTSTLVVKGGPVPMSNSVSASVWVPKDALIGDSNTIYTELDLTPSYEGQLFWSAATGTYPNYVITPTSAQLYISVHISKIPPPLPLLRNTYYWVPVLLDKAVSFIDPATGRTWDPMGAVTCNPPYLCAS